MELSRIKLVVADMDGTLLNSRHEVSPEFFELYERLRKKDVLFAAASGRQYGSILEKLSSINKEITIIAENGGFVVHRGLEIFSNPLENQQKELILKQLDSIENAQAVLCTKHSAYLMPNSQQFLDKLKEYYTQFEILKNLNDYQGEVMKIAIYHDVGSEQYIYPYVRHLEDELMVKVSGKNWVDVSHKNTNKGFALQKVQDKLGIKQEETMVFGDYNNDLEMLSMAHYSYAMANAHPKVVSTANYTTLSNDEMGVEMVLEELLRSKS
ncbi:MAG: HAD family hydrolase [Flavobacteriaceae bacterium]